MSALGKVAWSFRNEAEVEDDLEEVGKTLEEAEAEYFNEED